MRNHVRRRLRLQDCRVHPRALARGEPASAGRAGAAEHEGGELGDAAMTKVADVMNIQKSLLTSEEYIRFFKDRQAKESAA